MGDGNARSRNNTDGLCYEKYNGFELMQDLVDEMTHINPAKRPLAEDVVAKFSHPCKIPKRIQASVTLSIQTQPGLFTVFRCPKQALLNLHDILSRKDAVPEP